jgi:A/G-specific adenine glycosylase
MEKRPPTGIWGGLWCFYEVNEEADINALMATLSLNVLASQTLQTFRHTFSHFHLDITPIVLECQVILTPKINEPEQQKWYDLNKGLDVGLAASTQKLLTLLSKQTLN